MSETRSQCGRVLGQAVWGRGTGRKKRIQEETTLAGAGLGGAGSGASEESLSPILCLGVSTELSLQQDNQDLGPEEALGEHPLADLLGAGAGRRRAHPPDRAARPLSPTEW